MGVKMGRPELKVIVPMGDGDALSIGGNHLIHAARRNVDMTAIIMNNSIYGMTGGQVSPMTPAGKKSTTGLNGTFSKPFDAVALARGAGATFVARTTTYHANEIIDIISEGITHKGFSLIEIMTQCPTYYGRKNKIGGAVEMMQSYRDGTVKVGSKKAKEDPTLIERGIFVKEDAPEYVSSYLAFMETLQAGKKEKGQNSAPTGDHHG
jgi:2-oxoglutarate ferredoxin oxidoreductase subunit beta